MKVTGEHQFTYIPWTETLVVISLVMSMTVNAMVTTLIVFKIVKVFREVNSTSITQSGTCSLLRRVMFVIIESGMALFSIQLARLVATILAILMGERAYSALMLSSFIHQMVNVIIKSVVVTQLFY